MSTNGVPIQDISDTVGHKSTHVTETVYRHVIVPAIRGGASRHGQCVRAIDDADDASGHGESREPVVTWLVTLALDKRSKNAVELRGFEPLTFCMPCRRATSCAIAPHARRWKGPS